MKWTRKLPIPCGAMELYNTMKTWRGVADSACVGDAVSGSDLTRDELELDDDSFVFTVEPQGFNIVEPTCVVRPPFDG